MAKKTFLQGALILGIAGIIIKMLGAFFRIPLANMIGDEGMGYYMTAYPIYVLLLTLSTAGIPTAISKIVSEKNATGNRYGAHRVFELSFSLMFAIGVGTAAILFFGAEYIVKDVIGNPGAYYAMKAIAPALLFVPIMAAYRGYFQGLQDMNPTAISQVVEQIIRVVAGLSLAYYLFKNNTLQEAAAGASFGATAGSIAGAIFLVFLYLKRRKKIHEELKNHSRVQNETSAHILKRVIFIAIPITIGAAIMPIMNIIDTTIVMKRLQSIGFTIEAANSLYGQLTGMAGPIINFPQVLSMGIAISLVPVISDAFERKDFPFLRLNVESGVRVSMLIGLPCAFGMMALAEPIMLLLYPSQKASAVSAAACLTILAAGVIFLSLVQTLTGVLQGLGRPSIPVKNLLVGGIFKIGITYVLTGIPSINVKGAAVGTLVAYIIATSLNARAVIKYTGSKFNVNLVIIKPLIAAVSMAVVVIASHKILTRIISLNMSTVVSILAGVVVYGLVLIFVRGITHDDFGMIPKGRKLEAILIKLKLIRV